MFDDDPDDEQSGPELPVHPDDRLWRHPSEIAAYSPIPAAPTPARPFWSVAVVAGLAGATVAITALAVTGSLSPRVVERAASGSIPRTTTLSSLASPKSVRTLAADAAGFVVLVEAGTGTSFRSGSGVTLWPDGTLLTSADLVGSATSVSVTLSDGRTARGAVVGRDVASGIAVVRVPITGLPVARNPLVGPEPGDAAVTVGRPTANGRLSVTAGVVSSLEGQVSGRNGPMWGMIETDRPVPPRADGGALVDADGAVAGICLASNATNPVASGYAVPLDVATAVATDLVTYGKVRAAWLGVEGTDLPDAAAEQMDIAGGARLSRVVRDGPAADGGLRVDDVVIAVAAAPVRSMADLQHALAIHRPGQQIQFTVLRDGDMIENLVTLAEKQ